MIQPSNLEIKENIRARSAKLRIGRLGRNFMSWQYFYSRGVEDDVCIDIKTLRGASGATTIDRGFKNTASCESKITYLDGEKGILRYRGYDLDELANKASFLEVAYLLIFGELPTKKELDKFHDDIVDNSIVNDDVKKIVDAFPSSAHPMGVLSSLTSALTAFNPDDVSLDYDSCLLYTSDAADE